MNAPPFTLTKMSEPCDSRARSGVAGSPQRGSRAILSGGGVALVGDTALSENVGCVIGAVAASPDHALLAVPDFPRDGRVGLPRMTQGK